MVFLSVFFLLLVFFHSHRISFCVFFPHLHGSCLHPCSKGDPVIWMVIARVLPQLSSYDQPLNYDSDSWTFQGSGWILTCLILLYTCGVCFRAVSETFLRGLSVHLHKACLDLILLIRVKDMRTVVDFRVKEA